MPACDTPGGPPCNPHVFDGPTRKRYPDFRRLPYPEGRTRRGLPDIFDDLPGMPGGLPGRRQQTYEECQRAVRKSGMLHFVDPCRDLPFGGSNQFPDMDPTLPGRLPGGDRDIDPGIFPPTLPDRFPDKGQFPSLPTGPSVGEAVAGTAGRFLGEFLRKRLG